MKRIATSKDMLFEQRLAAEELIYPPDGIDPSEAVRAEDVYQTEADIYRRKVKDQIAGLNYWAQEPTTAPFQLRNKINDILETLDLLENSERPEEEYPHPQAHEGYPGGVSPHDEPPTFGAGNFRS